MKNYSILTFLLLSILLVVSCELQEEKISGSSGIQLRFSADTVLFDTLLTARTSITKRLRVFNPSKNAVSISSIRLGSGASSQYTIITNGKEGHELNDEVLFGGDSLLVLIDVEIDPKDENLPYLVKDSIIVDWNGNSANVKLVAWGQDAHFLNGDEICDETWTADRPYVIYNYALVDSLCFLNVEPGARIYLDNGAALFVKGSLKLLGDSTNRITVRNTRFDGGYGRDAPGQWDAIYFLEGSNNNQIEFTDIENGNIALRLETPDENDVYDVEVRNSSFRHMAIAGVLTYSSDLFMSNTEVYDCNLFLVANLLGGTYEYHHCTFSNYPNPWNDETPKVVVADNNLLEGEDFLQENSVSFTMRNSIIWGTNDEEFAVVATEDSEVTIELERNIIRTEGTLPFGNYASTEDNFPGFIDPINFDYDLDSLAFSRNKGVNLNYAYDIKGEPRDDRADIGAHERID